MKLKKKLPRRKLLKLENNNKAKDVNLLILFIEGPIGKFRSIFTSEAG